MVHARLFAAALLLAALTPCTGRSQPADTTQDQGGAVSPYSTAQPSPYRSYAPSDEGGGDQDAAPDQSAPPSTFAPQTFAPQGYPGAQQPGSYPPQGYPPQPGLPPPGAAGAPPPVPYGGFCDTGPASSCSLQRAAPIGARCVCPGYGQPTYGKVR